MLAGFTNFSKQMYDTLLYLRSINVVHRDLKPSNIIISDRPVLIDFGIAQNIMMIQLLVQGWLPAHLVI